MDTNNISTTGTIGYGIESFRRKEDLPYPGKVGFLYACYDPVLHPIQELYTWNDAISEYVLYQPEITNIAPVDGLGLSAATYDDQNAHISRDCEVLSMDHLPRVGHIDATYIVWINVDDDTKKKTFFKWVNENGGKYVKVEK